MAVFSSFSLDFFNTADYIVNNVLLIMGALFMALFVGWIWKMRNFAHEVGLESGKALVVWSVLIKYIAPVIIIIIWLAQLGIIDKISTFF